MTTAEEITVTSLLVEKMPNQANADAWMREPNPQLNGAPPAMRMAQGWAEPVIRILEGM